MACYGCVSVDSTTKNDQTLVCLGHATSSPTFPTRCIPMSLCVKIPPFVKLVPFIHVEIGHGPPAETAETVEPAGMKIDTCE